jgi:hypothetical protein
MVPGFLTIPFLGELVAVRVERGLTSNLSKCHAPLDWLATHRLSNPLQPQYSASRDDPEMQRDSLCGLDDADPFRSTPERKVMTMGKLDDVWNVATIGGQTSKGCRWRG